MSGLQVYRQLRYPSVTVGGISISELLGILLFLGATQFPQAIRGLDISSGRKRCAEAESS